MCRDRICVVSETSISYMYVIRVAICVLCVCVCMCVQTVLIRDSCMQLPINFICQVVDSSVTLTILSCSSDYTEKRAPATAPTEQEGTQGWYPVAA